MAKKKAARPKTSTLDFESAMVDIETIVTQLESGDLDLTQSLEQYEQGIQRLRQCHQILEAAEQKITLLSGFDTDGNPITEALPETSFRGTPPPASSGTPKRSKGVSSSLGKGDADEDDGSVDAPAGLF